MAQRALRFGVSDGTGRRGATWKLWTETGGGRPEVYLACRELGGKLKASLHATGQWHVAYSEDVYTRDVQGAIPSQKDRFLERWPRPPEIAPGVTLAFRIITPSSAVTSPAAQSEARHVRWIPNATESQAIETDVFLTSPSATVSTWPGHRSMNTSLVGSFALEGGETAWAVYHVVTLPERPGGTASGRFYKGRGPEDLIGTDSLRALGFGAEPDGSRVIYDCAVVRRSVTE